MIYAGITIGPIIDTMAMTSTPGGLWFSSYFFSSLMKSLLIAGQARDLEILTLPAEKRPAADDRDHGIGTYHDRVYFKTLCSDETAVEETLRKIIDEAVDEKSGELAEALGKTKGAVKKYLEGYLQIHFIIFKENDVKEKGIAKTLADALDGLELAQGIQADLGEDFLRIMLQGTVRDGSNVYIKKHLFYKNACSPSPNDFKLRQEKQDSIRDLASIASNGRYSSEDLKDNNVRLTGTERYFAIVQCDGDNMGKLIAGGSGELCDQEKAIKVFSKYCMTYTQKAAEIISDYGGVVIFAGGDDLLFLAPVVNEKGVNVWTLCREIGKVFDEIFPTFTDKKGKTDKPSLSAGVSINYYKFPLYEAFEDARELLFGEAKNLGEKNNIAVKLCKASGQNCGFVCSLGTKKIEDDAGEEKQEQTENSFDQYLNLLDLFYGKNANEKDKLMQSVLYHLEDQDFLFRLAMGDKKEMRTVLKNSFDNAGQTFAALMLDEIAGLSKLISESVDAGKLKGFSEDGQSDEGTDKMLALTSMLRMAHFLVEER